MEKHHKLIVADKKQIVQKKIDIGGKVIDFQEMIVVCKQRPQVKWILCRSPKNFKIRKSKYVGGDFISFQMPETVA